MPVAMQSPRFAIPRCTLVVLLVLLTGSASSNRTPGHARRTVCTASEAWTGQIFDRKDCMKAIDSMWDEVVEPSADELYEFVSKGATSTTTLKKMVTPITFESGMYVFVGKTARYGNLFILDRELCCGHCDDRELSISRSTSLATKRLSAIGYG